LAQLVLINSLLFKHWLSSQWPIANSIKSSKREQEQSQDKGKKNQITKIVFIKRENETETRQKASPDCIEFVEYRYLTGKTLLQ
jgi:hypothetical protein